ncbi:MAG: hypothetical protein ACI8ZM_003509 [Crocinitomix sp.]|jgi:hypothetical protein
MFKTRALILISVLFTGLYSYGQQFEWIKETWAGPWGEMSLSKQGHIFIDGSYSHDKNTVNGISLNNLGYPHDDLFLAKYDLDGNLIWVKTTENLSGGNNIDPHSNSFDADENIYISGYFSGSYKFETTTISSRGDNADVFIAKYTANGDVVWVKSMGSPNQGDFNYSIETDDIGNSYIFVKGVSSFEFDELTIEQPNDDYDYNLLLKIDSNGNYVWHETIKGFSYDKIALSESGEVYLSLSFQNDLIWPDIDTINSNGNADVMLCHYNVDGDLVEKKYLDCAQGLYVHDLQFDANNKLYALMRTSHLDPIIMGEDEVVLETTNDNSLLKFDQNLNFIWFTSFSNDTHFLSQAQNGLHFNPDNDPLVFFGAKDTNEMSFIHEGLYMLEMSADSGSLLKETYLENFPLCNKFEFDADFNLYAHGGNYNSNAMVLLQFVPDPSEGIQFVKVSGLIYLPDTSTNFAIYPNPTVEGFTIKRYFEEETELTLKIYTTDGKIIHDETILAEGELKHYVQSNEWASGVYFVGLIIGEKREVFKIVKPF